VSVEAPSDATFDVLAVGDVNPDLLVTGDVTPRFGQAEQDVDAHLTLGGSAGIFAAGAARLGLHTAIAATVGDDDLGRATRAMLVARDVDVSLIGVDPDRPTGLSINLQRDGDRAILTDRGAIVALEVEPLLERAGAGVRHVHMASVFLVPALPRDGAALLRAARLGGATTSVDTNFDPSERFEAPGWLREADVLTPNETEALALAGRGDGDVLAAARSLAAGGALVVVKRGAAGALAVHGDEIVEATAPAATGPDAIGAGDAFDAGLVWAFLDDLPLRDAVRIACACGTLSLRAAGGVDGQATLAEALRLAAGIP
jgi:sugar/nucleoside kinase (ribokinase family)